MSSYQARQRAIRAERAALRCEQLVEEMRDACRWEKRRYRDEVAEEFRLKHLHMEARQDWLMDQIVTIQKCQAPAFLVVPTPAERMTE